ncbi:MAG: DMT family transporter [Candidatus Actinomarinales bacterium]|nr:MAG: DMT family transporter [Candidatus Actinomarinales bacterium]
MIIKSEFSMSAYAGLRNIIIIGILYGFHGLINRSLLIDGVNEIFLVTARISLVCVILGLYCIRDFINEINLSYFLKGSLTGVLAILTPGWTFIYALKNISSGLVSVFISTIPLFTVIWVYFFYKDEKITKLKIFSILVGFIGLVILFLSGVTGISGDGDLTTGGILALIGVQGLALSNITNRKHSQYIPAKVYLFTQWLIGGLISIVLFLILGGNIGVITYSISLKILGLVFIDIASYSLFFYTIKRVSASFTTLVDYVVPVVGITAGYLLLDEVINNIFFITVLLIFISLYLAVKDESKNLH